MRTYLYAIGGGLFGFFLIQSYSQLNAYFTFERLEATAVRVLEGCISDERDDNLNRIIVSCESKAAITKTPTPYVTFKYTIPGGQTLVGQSAVGAIGFPRKGHVGDRFEIMVDPTNPKSVEAPIGRRYFEFTGTMGSIGACLLFLAYWSGGWTRRLHQSAFKKVADF